MNLTSKDKTYVWHPFTQHATEKEALIIDRAKGSYLYDLENKSYLDMISSWWTNTHGHGHPHLVQAIASQAAKLDHVMFARFSHQPGIDVAEKLISLLPHYAKVFYSDNGSTAVEAAIKIAIQYWHNHGARRNKLIAFEGGYHGDTFGAMSIGATSGFYHPFEDMFFQVIFNPYPETWDGDDPLQKEQEALKKLEVTLTSHPQEIAALIIEPLVQGASGMRMARASFLDQVVSLCNAHDVLVIFDEVMTGFGRTGPLFASHALSQQADLICLSKGITGGTLPLAATLVTERIFDAFLGTTFSKAFTHGHSYTANPIACAAALASLDLFSSLDSSQLRQQIQVYHQQYLTHITPHPLVARPRLTGTILAFDVVNTDTSYGSKLGDWLKEQFLKRGLNIRPLGNTIYLMPPYCITDKQLQEAYNGINEILQLLNQ